MGRSVAFVGMRQRPLTRAALLSVVFLLLLTSTAWGGRFEGRVVTRAGGPQRPVGGAEVRLVVVPPETVGYGADVENTDQVLETDARGRFRIDEMVIDASDGVRREALVRGSLLRIRIRAPGLPMLEEEVVYNGGVQRMTLLLRPAPRLVVRVLGRDERGLEAPLPDVRVYLTPRIEGEDDPLRGMHSVGVTDERGIALFEELNLKAFQGELERFAALEMGRDYIVEVRTPSYYVLHGETRLRDAYQGLELVLVPRSDTDVEDHTGIIRSNDKLLESGSVRRGE